MIVLSVVCSVHINNYFRGTPEITKTEVIMNENIPSINNIEWKQQVIDNYVMSFTVGYKQAIVDFQGDSLDIELQIIRFKEKMEN